MPCARRFGSLWLVLTLLASQVNAYDGCSDPCGYYRDPCCSEACCCGGVRLFTSILYVRPSFGNTPFVIVDQRPGSPPLPAGNEFLFCFPYNWAFRLGIAQIFDNRFESLSLIYTRIPHKHRVMIEGPAAGGLWPVFGQPKNLELRLDNGGGGDLPNAMAEFAGTIRYDEIDLIWGWKNCPNRLRWIRPHIAVRFFNATNHTDIIYRGTALSDGEPQAQEHFISLVCDTWGFGPHLGFGLRGPLICGLGVTVRGGVGITFGQVRFKRTQTDIIGDDEQELDIQPRRETAVPPFFYGRLGLDYSLRLRARLVFGAALGYEFTSYVDAARLMRFNDLGGTNRSLCSNVSYNGLYLTLRIEM